MASPVFASLLNLLSGGTQGFAEARQRRTTERAAIAEGEKERRFRGRLAEEEFSSRESIAAGEQAFQKEQEARRSKEFEAESTRRKEEFEAEQKFKSEQATKEDVYRTKILGYQQADLEAKTTIGQLQERIARLQTDTAEDKYDPFLQIQKAVSEVYTKNATGDTPEIAGQMATRAAVDLYQIYQSLGIIPTPIGPMPREGDEGVVESGITPGRFTKGNIAYRGGLTGITHPANKVLADTLRTLGNAPRN